MASEIQLLACRPSARGCGSGNRRVPDLLRSDPGNNGRTGDAGAAGAGRGFAGGQAEHWKPQPGPTDDNRTWHQPGVTSTVAQSASLWVRTTWKPEGGTPGTTEFAYLSISYTGVEGPPKSLLVTGEVIAPPAAEP